MLCGHKNYMAQEPRRVAGLVPLIITSSDALGNFTHLILVILGRHCSSQFWPKVGVPLSQEESHLIGTLDFLCLGSTRVRQKSQSWQG